MVHPIFLETKPELERIQKKLKKYLEKATPIVFVCDYPSFIKQATSTVNIQATTECEVYLLSLNRLNQFWETDMDTQRLGRQIAETMFAEIYQRLLGFYCDSPEQRYQSLMKRCPDLQEKLSLKEIAQFLGITPETLSRIRKKQLYT